MDIKKATDEYESEELSRIAKKRFYASPETSEIVFMPQCVYCSQNMGLEKCGVYGTKPTEYISNIEECPECDAPKEKM